MHGDLIETAFFGKHEKKISCLNSQKKQPLDNLSGQQIAKAHDQTGEPHGRSPAAQRPL